MYLAKLMNLIILSTFPLLLAACDYSNSKALRETPFQVGLGKADVTFKTVSEKVLQSNCVACHSNYSNYESVKIELNSILTAVNSDRMPKRGPPLSIADKQLLAAWANAGAPDFQTEEPKSPIGLEPNWPSISVRLIFPKCLVCHNPQGQAKFLDLSSRQSFFNARNRDFGGQKLLDFETPNNSYLISIVQDPDEPMPPTKSRIPALTSEEVRILTTWIELGLP